MASQLHMSFTLTAREELDAGSSQTHSVIDSVAQRTWGGKINKDYTSHTTDGSSKIIVYENAKIALNSLSSGSGLDATWFNTTHPDYVTRGSLPSNIYGLVIELVELSGSATYVRTHWNGVEMSQLDNVGEAYVFPLNGSAPSVIDLITNYALSSNTYALVNVLIAGT